MSMPFYVSPEQLMKDRADYARKGNGGGSGGKKDDSGGGSSSRLGRGSTRTSA